MSYREENGQVVLTISGEDYARLLTMLGRAMAETISMAFAAGYFAQAKAEVSLLNRLNQGNPNYTPYEVPDGKAS
jgi:hypothetical protein